MNLYKQTMNRIQNLHGRLSISGLIVCCGINAQGFMYNSLLNYFGKKTVLEMILDRFVASKCKNITLVISRNDIERIKPIAKMYPNVSLCLGGDTRCASVRAGLNFIGQCDIVVIHDGARPYVTTKTINDCINSALHHGSGITASPNVNTVKIIDDYKVIRSLAQKGIYNIHTPQAYSYQKIQYAYDNLVVESDDDSLIYASAGYQPNIVLGDANNIPVTSVNDVLNPYMGLSSKIGAGFDVHQLTEGRKLVLGGIKIKHYKGLVGHSDADVLVHAIMDALLSASELPDIGVLFPNTDQKFANANSITLLKKVLTFVKNKGYSIGNISAVIMAQRPLLAPHIPAMKENIAKALKIDNSAINISATTTENLGIIGNEQGIASSATCILYK